MGKSYWDIVIPTASHGGVENCINILSKELINIGYQIRVIQLISERDVWLDKDIPFYELSYGKDGHNVRELAERYAQFLIDNGAPEVVIATNWPLCVYIVKLALASCALNIPTLSWVHSPVKRYAEVGIGGFEYLGLADGHLAISNQIFSEINQKLYQANVYRVSNPVVMNLDENKGNCRATEFCNRLAFVGRISKEKGLDIIIEALALSKSEWSIDIVGDAEDKTEKLKVEQLIKENNLDNRVKMWGWQKAPWSVLENIDFLCMHSSVEGFGLVAIEALSRGIPVISTPVGGMLEFVVPGKTGYFVSHRNAKELAEVLDAIDKGLLPVPEANVCKDAVIPKYDSKFVAKEFGETVSAFVKNFEPNIV